MSFRNSRKKIGIYGGTFDPVHIVHLIVAEQAKTMLELDEIWFMPARIPPHKQGKKITDHDHRVEMLHRAVRENQDFYITAIELEQKQEEPSYTFNTIVQLKNQYPAVDFFFIIGGDMVEYLPKWYNIDKLVELIQFVAFARPGYQMDNCYKEQIIQVEMPQLDLSSSIIRKKVQAGLSIRYLVPESVRLYIEENRLYEA